VSDTDEVRPRDHGAFGLVKGTGLPEPAYDHVLEFLKRNHRKKLREVTEVEIDISEVIR
jgi:hypothetical protein